MRSTKTAKNKNKPGYAIVTIYIPNHKIVSFRFSYNPNTNALSNIQDEIRKAISKNGKIINGD